MADHLTEEEQIQALKRWWDENWASIVLPIVVLLVGYSGWNYWNSYQDGQAQIASQQFSALTTAAETQPGQAMSAEQKEKVGQIAETILKEHGDTLYGDMANMIMAKMLIEDGELDAAQTRLQTVADTGADQAVKQLAKARLARVLAAKGENDKALSLLADSPSEAYKSLYAEIKGDIYLAQGKAEAANTAYGDAIAALPQGEFNRASLLRLKQDAVAVPQEEAAAEESTESEPAAAEGDA